MSKRYKTENGYIAFINDVSTLKHKQVKLCPLSDDLVNAKTSTELLQAIIKSPKELWTKTELTYLSTRLIELAKQPPSQPQAYASFSGECSYIS